MVSVKVNDLGSVANGGTFYREEVVQMLHLFDKLDIDHSGSLDFGDLVRIAHATSAEGPLNHKARPSETSHISQMSSVVNLN